MTSLGNVSPLQTDIYLYIYCASQITFTDQISHVAETYAEWIRVNLPTKIPHYPDFKLGSYPRPHLPLTPTQGHAIGRALPVARPLTPPPPSEAPSAPPIRDDASKQAAFQPEWDMLQADLSSSSGANAHPNAAAAAKRDQEMAIKDELTLMEINTMRANDERDRLAAAARASAGDDSTAFKPKAEEPIEEDTKPNLEQSIEQELALMERLDERRARKALSEDVSPKVEQSVEQEHVASEPVRKPSADRHEARNIRPDVEEDTAIEQGTTQDASASGTPRLVKSEDGPVPQSSTGLGVKREADEETGTIGQCDFISYQCIMDLSKLIWFMPCYSVAVNKKLKLES